MEQSLSEKKFKLLTRDQFREQVLKRDCNCCVICKSTIDLSVHHILNRKLFIDDFELGGYFIENGISLCEEHHLEAESTNLPCEELREAAGITDFPIPNQLGPGIYDTWGNTMLPNGTRTKGPLYSDDQKILDSVRHLMSSTQKYPRTPHFSFSPGSTSDDRILKNHKHFEGKEVVASTKIDGESASVYTQFYHARSLEGADHPSRHWFKQYIKSFQYEIPENWRFCFEQCYAVHSIEYKHLSTYAYLISIWNEKNYCLSWDETLDWCQLLNLTPVPVLYCGIWNEEKIKSLYQEYDQNGDLMEGFVIRLSNSFHYSKFGESVAKFVRKGHVTSEEHWKHKEIKINGLKK